MNNRLKSHIRLGFLMLGFSLIFSVAQAERIRYDKGGRRDPFQPLIGPHAYRGGADFGKDVIPVEGIIFDPKTGSYAIINGEIYREGDTINGAKLIKVLSDRLILHQESEEVTIWLREEVLQANQKNLKEHVEN